MTIFIYVIAALAGGTGLGYAARIYIAKQQNDQLEQKQKEILLEAKTEALKIKEDAKKDEERSKKDLQELEKSLRRREEMIDRRLDSVEDEKKKILDKEKEINEIKDQIGDIKKRQTSLQDWLRSDQRPEAVLCADDYYALRVQMSAAEIGLRYPDDFALASVGKEPSLEEYFRVPLTTMLLPRYEMATAAVTMAIAMVNAAVSLNQPAQVFQSQLCPGESAPACNSEQQSGEILKNSVAR